MNAESDRNGLLEGQRNSRRDSLDRLLPVVYEELRAIAHRHLAKHGPGGSLATTGLVHEAYLKLVDQSQAEWRDRAHFLALSSLAMRHVLVDQARARAALKRGGVGTRVTLDEEAIAVDDSAETLMRSTKRSNGWPRWSLGSRKSSSVDSSRGCPSKRSPKHSALRNAPSSATGSRRGCCSTARSLREERSLGCPRVSGQFLPDRWNELAPLLDAALEREPADRPAFLDRACAGDTALRAELETLLADCERSDRLFVIGAAERFAALFAEPQRRLPELVAGRYRIGRELGAGGMATVYLARDLKHDRDVALKVLRADLSAVIGADAVPRGGAHHREARPPAHPHAHRLGQRGRHSLLCNAVRRGETLRAKLARERQLSMEDALSITRQVAAALDYAHTKAWCIATSSPRTFFSTRVRRSSRISASRSPCRRRPGAASLRPASRSARRST